ncbi:DUF5059 domain-containing protein [Halobacteriaceae archaeon GCM10025711]
MLRTTRRKLLRAGGALSIAGLAGCTGDVLDSGSSPSAKTAVAAEWSVLRARLYDSLALGLAGERGASAAVARDAFARFEQAGGEWGAHTVLERTSEDHYEGFERALRTLADADDLGKLVDATADGDDHLRAAQRALAGDATVRTLDLVVFAARLQNVAVLTGAGAFGAAARVGRRVESAFADAAVRNDLDDATRDAFETALSEATSAATTRDAQAATEQASAGFDAAVEGAYRVAPAASVAGAGHLAGLQARAFDASALAAMGGPSTAFAHASVLNGYRARVHDAARLFDRGAADAAGQVVEAIFADFEGASAHDALESAAPDAYHGFEEDGLGALQTAIDEGDADAVHAAVETVDRNLLAGVEALGTGVEPAVLQAGFFRARLADAGERYRAGDRSAAAAVAQGLFEAFEANAADFHETLEDADHDLYERFEETHLAGLVDAFEQGDDTAVENHLAGALDALLAFEASVGTPAQVSGAEAGFMAARAFDAAAHAAHDEYGRAEAILQGAFEHFENGAGGFHEAAEHADHERYEQFEAALADASSAAADGGDVRAAVRAFDGQAVETVYAVVAGAGGTDAEESARVVDRTATAFADSRVEQLVADAHQSSGQRLSTALDDLAGAYQDGDGVRDATHAFANAARQAEFAVVGAVEKAPDGTAESGRNDQLSGGPNVVDGVPSDADHVVEMTAVAFEPAELTVSAGDTVAWKHVGGEPHSVTAYGDELPEGAAYWASGGFDDEDAAVEGWEAGEGTVQSGQSFVHTFETAGEHAYYCIPHEAAGMVGTVVVE